MKDYDGKLRIAMMHNALPMHNRAMPAAIAAEAAGRQGKFWEMHEKLFTDTRALGDDDFEKYANELGLDVAKFKKDMEDPALKKKIEEQMRLANTLGARGTPAFFINGRFLSGAQPIDAFKAVIDEEMKKAEKLVASGTPKDQVYDKTIAKGLAKP
jgi:protein-disulfide isomerase